MKKFNVSLVLVLVALLVAGFGVFAYAADANELVIADFDTGDKPNNIGGDFGGWDKDPNDESQGTQMSFDTDDSQGDASGYAIRLDYDVDSPKTLQGCISKPLNELLPWADIITLHCSALQGGGYMIGKEELARMKKGSWLLNTARGGLVDEVALCASLKEGRLLGAALDVFEKEPYVGPLSELDNVILTSHMGSYAREARIKMEIDAVENLLKGLACEGAHRRA
jgi:hypothetical protein